MMIVDTTVWIDYLIGDAFSAEEDERIIAACDRYPRGRRHPARVKAFVLVWRYSGLRIGDVVGLRRDDVNDGWLALRTMKTGERVYLPLPQVAIDALAVVANGEYYFWTGRGLRKSAVADWQRSLRRVCKLAKVTGNPHMFRHTFATDLLSRGVPVEDVDAKLGQNTVQKGRHLIQHADEATKANLRAGETTINRDHDRVEWPPGSRLHNFIRFRHHGPRLVSVVSSSRYRPH